MKVTGIYGASVHYVRSLNSVIRSCLRPVQFMFAFSSNMSVKGHAQKTTNKQISVSYALRAPQWKNVSFWLLIQFNQPSSSRESNKPAQVPFYQNHHLWLKGQTITPLQHNKRSGCHSMVCTSDTELTPTVFAAFFVTCFYNESPTHFNRKHSNIETQKCLLYVPS